MPQHVNQHARSGSAGGSLPEAERTFYSMLPLSVSLGKKDAMNCFKPRMKTVGISIRENGRKKKQEKAKEKTKKKKKRNTGKKGSRKRERGNRRNPSGWNSKVFLLRKP